MILIQKPFSYCLKDLVYIATAKAIRTVGAQAPPTPLPQIYPLTTLATAIPQKKHDRASHRIVIADQQVESKL